MSKLITVIFLILSTLVTAQNSSQERAITLVKEAIAQKAKNDPREVLDNFTYRIYEKTIITDSLNGNAHSFFSEKVSDLYASKKERFTEKIIGYQLAGFETPRYEVFAVNVQSRSFYDDDFIIFNNRYLGILSKKGLKNYNYTIEGTSDNGGFIISFSPKNSKRIPGFTGTMTLDRETLAIKNIQLSITDNLNIQLQQEYIYLDDVQLYVPSHRKLFLDKGATDKRLSFFNGKISIGTIENEVIEDMVTRKFLVTSTIMRDYKINTPSTPPTTSYAITFEKDANTKDDTFWSTYREAALTSKDKRSFSEIERIVNAENIERRLGTINNFSVGYFSVKAFDFDLTYPVKFNNFEGLRLGLGGVTNEDFSKRFRVEGYGAYGFKDRAFKFGIGSGVLLSPEKGMWLSATYSNDIEEVGSFPYLTDRRVYSLFEPRLVNITQFFSHKTARANLEYRVTPQILSEFQVAHRAIEQSIPYSFQVRDDIIRDYNITEATAAFRWSPANRYLKTDSDAFPIYEGYPIVSGQISHSFDGLGGDLGFTRLGAKAFYRVDQLNKSATELLVEGNIAFGDVPLTHLFHAYPNAPTKETILQRFSVAGVNSFETMFFGEFFSDKLFTAQIKHRLKPFNFGKRFKPEMVFISRFAIGDISNPEDHLDTSFESLDQGYTESGFEINRLFYAFGTSFTYRYGAYHLSNWEDNIAFKFTFNQKL